MAELKFPTLEEFGRQGAEWALDVFEYKGHTIREWADKITTGECQPVKHGRWIFADDGYCRCSECNQKAPSIEDEVTMTDHCPHCGARMDGENE